MKLLKTCFTNFVEFIAASLLAAIFVVFVLQVFTRYAAKIAWLMPITSFSDWMLTLQPLGWTINFISLSWVWLIFVGCAFVVRARDHVTFDIVYLSVSPKVRKLLESFIAVSMIALMLYSLPAIWDTFFDNRLMDLKKIQTLRIPFSGDKIALKWLFAPFFLLMIALILRYSWSIFSLFRNGDKQS